MVTRSLFTGVSGLQSHLDKMDVLSDNLSNVNTPGFKKSNVVFKSFLSQKIASATRPTESRGGVNPQQIGLGVETGSINLDMSQGQLQRTGINTDLAVQGKGFFEVRESGSENQLFTRAGSFQIDANGRLVDPANGNVVQGFNSQVEDGAIVFNPETAPVEDIQIGQEQEVIPGEATTEQQLAGNLDAGAEVGIDPITVDFENSAVRFEFERYHPTEKMYRFNAVWTQNPPSGKQIGDAVEDQITGRDLEGIMRLNEDGQVTGIFDNPDRSGNVSASRIEVDRDNAGDYTLDRSAFAIRDQNDLFSDLEPDVTEQFRILIGEDGQAGGPDASGGNNRFILQWQDVDGNWQDFSLESGAGEHDDGSGNGYGVIGNDFVLTRETSSGDERVGEIRIGSDFWQTVNNPGQGDIIYFQAQAGEGNEILNQTGEEVAQEFRWAGSETSDRFRVSTPDANSGNPAGSGTLRSVSNYDEPTALANLNDSTAINDLQNKEFVVNFNSPSTFRVYTDLSGDNTIDTSNGSADELVNQNGSADMDVADDHLLFDGGTELGLEIAADDWTGSFSGGDQFNFTVTESRSVDDSRPFMVAQDGDGNDTALFAPEGTSSQPSSINFTPNLNDTSGILNDTSGTFTDLLAGSGSGAEATAKSDDEIQKATSSDVFDSLGEQHTLTYRFEKKDTNEWMWHALDPAPVDTDNPNIAGFGRLFFNENGGIETSETFNSRVATDLPPPGPEGDLEQQRVYFNPPDQTLQSDPTESDSQNPDVGAEPVSILPDYSDVTQFAGASDVEVADQDGAARGRLEALNFDAAGILNGSYDNGETRQLAQVVLTTFRNPEGLEKQGSTYFAQSPNSGIPRQGQPGSGGRGTITPGALERSNVDLSEQFTQLISTQRGFQANTRTIQTSDQLIQEVLQLV